MTITAPTTAAVASPPCPVPPTEWPLMTDEFTFSITTTPFDEDYRPAVYGTLIYFVLGILYFAIAGRHRLVLSPEEEFALTQGKAGVPGEAGFTTSQAEQESILRGGGGGEAPPPATPQSQ